MRAERDSDGVTHRLAAVAVDTGKHHAGERQHLEYAS